MATMRKREAVGLFQSVSNLAQGLGISVQAFYQWPDPLDQRRADWVMGAALRLGLLGEKNGRARLLPRPRAVR